MNQNSSTSSAGPLRLAIFGATGRTGQHLVRLALEAGHTVTALARDPGKLAAQSDRLVMVQGSLSDPECVARVVAGADAVISALGPSSNQPTFEISQGMANIVAAMQKQGIRRLVIAAGAGVRHPGDRPGLFDKVMGVLLKATAKNVFEDMLRAVDLVRQSSLEWTIVRVPMLTDAPAAGQVKVGMVGDGMGPRITRADMAGFMLRQASSSEHLRKAPAISN